MAARLAANAWDAETAERTGQVQVPGDRIMVDMEVIVS